MSSVTYSGQRLSYLDPGVLINQVINITWLINTVWVVLPRANISQTWTNLIAAPINVAWIYYAN